MGTDFNIKNTVKKNPKIKISSIEEEYTSDQELVESLVAQNASIDNTDEFKIVYKKEVNGLFDYVIECIPKTLVKVVNKYVNIGWRDHFVKEYIYAPKCSNCNDYGHFKQVCTRQSLCGKCAGKHNTWNCKEKKEECCNCKKKNLKYDDHSATSKSCPVYKKQLQYVKEKINYVTSLQ